jgi:hypothetical protein
MACFESFGTVYFGPYSWLAAQSPAMQPVEWSGGIDTIDGTYDIGQPLSTLTVTAHADSWFPTCGQAVQINNLGPFSTAGATPGIWLVSEIERDNLQEPDVTITLMQPLAGLPEPASGGAAAAVGLSSTVKAQPDFRRGRSGENCRRFCVKQLGKPYGGEIPLATTARGSSRRPMRRLA